jgi:hypothetical protein
MMHRLSSPWPAVACAFLCACGGATASPGGANADPTDAGSTDAASDADGSSDAGAPADAARQDDGSDVDASFPMGVDAIAPPPVPVCDNCADQSLFCNPATMTCVQCLTDDNCGGFSTVVCLPNHTCGCNADSACNGGDLRGARCLPGVSHCGCTSNADCARLPSTYATCASTGVCGCTTDADCASTGDKCDHATGACEECVVDTDCTDPNNRVCSSTIHTCLPCRASRDCAQNGDGPTCAGFGRLETDIGDCSCAADAECASRAGGPHCQIQNNWGKCGCASAAECSSSSYGHACVNPYMDGWLQCGCNADGDCPAGLRCIGYQCQP